MALPVRALGSFNFCWANSKVASDMIGGVKPSTTIHSLGSVTVLKRLIEFLSLRVGVNRNAEVFEREPRSNVYTGRRPSAGRRRDFFLLIKLATQPVIVCGCTLGWARINWYFGDRSPFPPPPQFIPRRFRCYGGEYLF